MPGYGYARVSKTKRKEWRKMVEGYLLHRSQLICAFQLMDFRVGPQKNDMEFAAWMSQTRGPFAIIFTKTDKVKEKDRRDQYRKFEEEFLTHWTSIPPIFYSSAETGLGRETILQYISGLNDQYLNYIETRLS